MAQRQTAAPVTATDPEMRHNSMALSWKNLLIVVTRSHVLAYTNLVSHLLDCEPLERAEDHPALTPPLMPRLALCPAPGRHPEQLGSKYIFYQSLSVNAVVTKKTFFFREIIHFPKPTCKNFLL